MQYYMLCKKKVVAEKNKIWLSSPHMGGTEEKYIKEAFDTNWVAPMGQNVNQFEVAISESLSSSIQYHSVVLTSHF